MHEGHVVRRHTRSQHPGQFVVNIDTAQRVENSSMHSPKWLDSDFIEAESKTNSGLSLHNSSGTDAMPAIPSALASNAVVVTGMLVHEHS